MNQKPFDYRIEKEAALDACQVLLGKAGFSDEVIALVVEKLAWEMEGEPEENCETPLE